MLVHPPSQVAYQRRAERRVDYFSERNCKQRAT